MMKGIADMNTATNLSKYIILKCMEDKCPITNLYLQKILYYIQKEYLKQDKIAFLDDIEAWVFGPIIPKVYNDYCKYGGMPVLLYTDKPKINTADRMIIDKIVENKRKQKIWYMIEDIHRVNGAWYQTYRDGKGNKQVIPIDLIKSSG
jgi:uncharacterized phage-associated protein